MQRDALSDLAAEERCRGMRKDAEGGTWKDDEG